MNKNDGFTLLEVIAVVAALIVIIGLIVAGLDAKIRHAEAQECITTLAGLTQVQRLCFAEKDNNDQLCVACTSYNASIAAFNTSAKCGKFGPIAPPMTCPNPPRPATVPPSLPPSD